MLGQLRMRSLLSNSEGPPVSPYRRIFRDQDKMSSPRDADPYPQPNFQQTPIQLGDIEEPAPVSSSSRFYDELQRIRNEATPGLTAYKEALNRMPTPEEYKPNWLTRIASGLSGFSAGARDAGKGIEVAMGLNRAPYRHAMEEYSDRL